VRPPYTLCDDDDDNATDLEPWLSIAAVLPCNVVVRSLDPHTTVVEAFDPDAMMGLADNKALHTIATDAKQRINAAFAALNEEI
jgi:hypothetical protein